MIIPLSDIKIGIENLKHVLDMTSQFGLTDILTDESVNLYRQRFRAHYRKQKYTIISCKIAETERKLHTDASRFGFKMVPFYYYACRRTTLAEEKYASYELEV
uniref:Uncharacterized protein n=1 Tax=Vespula pensylvanica TaxID=30213 RepID=A0A834UGP6_VESPE|nr:hypothetical protein H0235_001071 [Vespula pensylvanica]